MKHLKGLREIKQVLLIQDRDSKHPSVRGDLFLSKLDTLISAGLGLPLVIHAMSDRIFLKFYVGSSGEFFDVFVTTPKPTEFIAGMKVKIAEFN